MRSFLDGQFIHLQRFGGVFVSQVDISHRAVYLVEPILMFGLAGHRAQLVQAALATQLCHADAGIEIHFIRRRHSDDGLIGMRRVIAFPLQLV